MTRNRRFVGMYDFEEFPNLMLDKKQGLMNQNSIPCRVPITFCWDNEDARILACETRRLLTSNDKRPPTSMGTMRSGEKKSSPSHQTSVDTVESQVFILFPTNDVRNMMKSMEILDLQFGEQLIDVYTPYVVSGFYFSH